MRHFVGISATKEHDGLQIGYLSLNGLSRSFCKSFKGKLEGLVQKALSIKLVPVHPCSWGKTEPVVITGQPPVGWNHPQNHRAYHTTFMAGIITTAGC